MAEAAPQAQRTNRDRSAEERHDHELGLVLQLIRAGEYRRAMQRPASGGLAEGTPEELRDALQGKFYQEPYPQAAPADREFDPRASRPEEATALAAAVSTLVLHGWHPLWCVVCDEAWLWIARQRERLLAVASPDGEPPGVQLNYDFMAWYIDPVATQSGWVRRTMAAEPSGLHSSKSASNDRVRTGAAPGSALRWAGSRRRHGVRDRVAGAD